MAKTKTTYRKLNLFNQYLRRLIADKEDFELSETSFTKKVRNGNNVIIFNETGEQDPKLLQLISKVRNDASYYNIEDLEDEDKLQNIWFDLTERPEETIIAKVDVKSAYWETAIKLGVISDATNAFLADNFAGREYKLARLKALGSLATKKTIISYVGGQRVSSKHLIQETRKLYMYICSMLDEVMQSACMHLDGAFYYYWDCVFVSDKHHNAVREFLKDNDYNSTLEQTNVQIIRLGDTPALLTHNGSKSIITPADVKRYPIPPDKQWLLNV